MNQTLPISPSPKTVGGMVPDAQPGENASGGLDDASFAETLAGTVVTVLPSDAVLLDQAQVESQGLLALPDAALAEPSLEVDDGKLLPQSGNALPQAGEGMPQPVPSGSPVRVGELATTDSDRVKPDLSAKGAADQLRLTEPREAEAKLAGTASIAPDSNTFKVTGEPRRPSANSATDPLVPGKRPGADAHLTQTIAAKPIKQSVPLAAPSADSAAATAIAAEVVRASPVPLAGNPSGDAGAKGRQGSAPGAPIDLIAPQMAKSDLGEIVQAKIAAPLETANPTAANQFAPSPPVSLAADARGELRISPALEQSIEQLVQLRESTRAARPEILMRHAEFGLVNVRVEAVASDIRASLSARDPGFVPAVQAMIAERALGTVNETQSAGQRGAESGQSGASTQTDRDMAGSWGSSRGDEPTPQETHGAAADFNRPHEAEVPDRRNEPSAPGDTGNRGLFA